MAESSRKLEPQAEQQPFQIRLKPYGGNSESRLRIRSAEIALADRISEYIDQKRDRAKACYFPYSEIADELNIGEQSVQKLLAPMGGSQYGITV